MKPSNYYTMLINLSLITGCYSYSIAIQLVVNFVISCRTACDGLISGPGHCPFLYMTRLTCIELYIS